MKIICPVCAKIAVTIHQNKIKFILIANDHGCINCGDGYLFSLSAFNKVWKQCVPARVSILPHNSLKILLQDKSAYLTEATSLPLLRYVYRD